MYLFLRTNVLSVWGNKVELYMNKNQRDVNLVPVYASFI